ncbi:MAG: gluconate 2-dehydrogenase subunit 3 family protein [Kordiimonadaceae bacterium]|jgi:hypothetical protein|nr:gluconate 2-dehydrogenase subunit 3 family protein [Kordiimonadaceae bacterium]
MTKNNDLNRRQILERMSLVMGGAVSLTVLSACDGGVSVPTKEEVENGIPLKALNQAQLDLIGDMADTIIPDTETPGAKSVNVHYLIDELAVNWMKASEKTIFLGKLTALDERIKVEHGKSFSELDMAGRGAVLDQLGAEMIAEGEAADGEEQNIYRELRELILFGYYTSEVGASEELLYDPIPGDFKGCVPYSEIGKAWSA